MLQLYFVSFDPYCDCLATYVMAANAYGAINLAAYYLGLEPDDKRVYNAWVERA